MCGRFVIDDNGDIAEMRRIFDELKKHYNDTLEFQNVKRGEIYPSDTVPVIIPEKELKIDAVPMRWGITNKYDSKLLINARSEGIYEKAMFKDSIKNKRCVIPSNGFFEWARFSERSVKEKFLIKPAHSPMLYFAGIYEKFPNPDPDALDKEQARFVIMTREAMGNALRSIHHRMPVIVELKDILKWLNGSKNDIAEIYTNPAVPEYTFTNLGNVG